VYLKTQKHFMRQLQFSIFFHFNFFLCFLKVEYSNSKSIFSTFEFHCFQLFGQHFEKKSVLNNVLNLSFLQYQRN